MTITEKLIRDIVEGEFQAQGFYEEEPVRPVPGPPAEAGEVARLESFLGQRRLAIPPSYRDFLAICNGIKDFTIGLSLFDTGEVMAPVHKTIRKDYPALSQFLIGGGDSLEFIAFDPASVVGKELEVAWVKDDGTESRFPSFAHFLHKRLTQVRRIVELEEADRADLDD